MNDTATAQDTSRRVIDTYYDTLMGGMTSFNEERLREILAPELCFEGPIAGRRVGAAGFVKGVTGFTETMHGLVMLSRLDAGNQVATLYDAEMPGGRVRFAEFFEVAGGRIESIRLLYDATEYRARGGH